MGDGTRLNRETYERLIAENRAWLAKQPRTLERDHIDLILKASPDHEYGCDAEVAALKARNAELESRVVPVNMAAARLSARVAKLTAALKREVLNMSADRSWCTICRTETTGPHTAEKFTHPHAATCALAEAES